METHESQAMHGARIELTPEQRKAIKRITSKENWFHSYTEEAFAVCSNHVDQEWKKVNRDGSCERM